MRIVLATLVLNEMEWLPKLYEQHKDWPELRAWIFVEAADVMYGQANPELVTSTGLSTDGTNSFLGDLAEKDPRVKHIPHGWTKHTNPAQGKIEARNRYFQLCEELNPDFVWVLDADEFYTKKHQSQIFSLLNETPSYISAFQLKQRDIWRPQSIVTQPLMKHEVIGGYWDVCHYRGWRWRTGVRYVVNHNHPSDHVGLLTRRPKHLDTEKTAPQCIHMGFASNHQARTAKHKYYIQRGEGRTDHRKSYVECRRAFETWQPGDKLPQGAKVINYTGPIPECFNERS